MTHTPNVYGYVNGKPVFSRDEFIFEHRKRGPIEDDAELIAFAEKATSGWHNAGWSHSFISFYLSKKHAKPPKLRTTLGAGGSRRRSTGPTTASRKSTRTKTVTPSTSRSSARTATPAEEVQNMNTKAIRQLADVTLDKYRSSIPRKAFEEFVKDIIAGENRATAFRYEASPICRASFPSTLDEDGARCTVEVTVYRLNAVAATAFLLDGPETLLRHIGLDERDTYTTKHEIDDLVTVVHITREEAPAWQH